jgi:hypothetical protein
LGLQVENDHGFWRRVGPVASKIMACRQFENGGAKTTCDLPFPSAALAGGIDCSLKIRYIDLDESDVLPGNLRCTPKSLPSAPN